MGRESRNNPIGQPGGPPLHFPGGRINTQPAEVHDLYDRPIEVGDLIELRLPNAPLFTVRAIERADPQPNQAEGLMLVTIGIQLRFLAPRVIPQNEFCRILTKAEAEARGLVLPPAAESPKEGDPT